MTGLKETEAIFKLSSTSAGQTLEGAAQNTATTGSDLA